MTEELSPSEVAKRLGTSTRSVQRWIATGHLQARRVGGRWRVAFDATDAVMPAPTSIRTVFVANRGEIAARIRRTCDRLGIRTITPPATGPDALDLLEIDAVVAAARRSSADAIHPGFGFLAENTAFAEAVIEAGIRWIGPPPGAIRTMGDKAAARHLATKLGVPTPTGYDDPDQSDTALSAAAERIGYPILVKPAAGGGGKGMRTVRSPDRLEPEIATARREATAAFGDDGLILEQLIEGARHVEIQVLFDALGNGVHLGERDCSLQRRHQKVLEEAPSPAVLSSVGGDLRRRMGDAALTLAGAVDYQGAGTCEFLVDERGAFTFLEMNTRLQVEHPVTELVTGRDLVEDQIRIAAGEPLGFTQRDVELDGHAIEVRIYAEDAEQGFLPAIGRIERLRWPSGDGIRVDAGVDEGDEVGGRFDPMLAKIIAHGRERAEALERLTRALDSTLILGLTTNLRFLRWLVREPVVRDGLARTDTLERIWPPDDWAQRTRIPEAAWVAAARALLADGEPEAGFRLNAAPTVRLAVDHEVRTIRLTPGSATTRAAQVRAGDTVHLDLAGRSIPFRVAPPPDVDRAASAAAAAHGTGPVEVLAPMPGQVLSIGVGVGTAVEAGDAIITLEAMKMEHAVTAGSNGTVGDVFVRVGDQVQRGQRLAVVEPR
ncbi:MAG TPA: biotin carboxylase N-terminal domain-containing protein [Candidatus Limnocylindrales bacterium]|nr:biotin carboxylase N-terminal domain-containing protein [Candidatus Limnocylindrales bacterium]